MNSKKLRSQAVLLCQNQRGLVLANSYSKVQNTAWIEILSWKTSVMFRKHTGSLGIYVFISLVISVIVVLCRFLRFLKNLFPLPIPAVTNGNAALNGAQAAPLSVLTGNKCASYICVCRMG